MDQNQNAHGAFAATGSHQPAALPHLPGASWSAPPDQAEPPGDDPDFATDEQADAYWQGVADGIRQVGGIVPARLAARAAPGNLLVPTEDDPSPVQDPDDILAFTPASLRARHDGWTPEKQVAFVEALADTGIIRAAAGKVGMTPQSVSRLRRRKEARAFDLACRAAEQIGRRGIVSVAWERAIEGTIRRHYFHGELKSEERVFNDRLLMALLNRLPPDPAEDRETEAVERSWDDWMDAIAEGRDPPAPLQAPDAASPADAEPRTGAQPIEARVWEDEGELFTNAPPPAGFELDQDGTPSDAFYQRRLTEAEEAYWEKEGEAAAHEDRGWLGTEWLLGRPTFFPWGCEPSALSAEAESERSEASEHSDESREVPADGSSPDEPDRRHGFAGTPPSSPDTPDDENPDSAIA